MNGSEPWRTASGGSREDRGPWTSPENRLREIISGLSPEEKARLAIEDGLRKEPVLSPGDRHKMVRALNPQEGTRYNTVIGRYKSLLENLDLLTRLVDQARGQLLLRDRILWFERALVELEEAIVFDAAVADALLVKNPNLEAGNPLVLRMSLGTIRLGVWGNKERSPFGKKGGVQLDERMVEALEHHIGRARRLAGDVKAIYGYLVDESRAIGLDFAEGFATGVVRQISEYDRPLLEDLLGEKNDGAPPRDAWRRESVFPVDKARALVWEEIEEDAETARRIRDDPDDWVPVSHDGALDELSSRLLEVLNGEAEKGAGRWAGVSGRPS